MNDIISYERNKLINRNIIGLPISSYFCTASRIIFYDHLVDGDIDNNVIKSMYLPSLSIPVIFTAHKY